MSNKNNTNKQSASADSSAATCYPVSVERGWTPEEGYEIAKGALRLQIQTHEERIKMLEELSDKLPKNMMSEFYERICQGCFDTPFKP